MPTNPVIVEKTDTELTGVASAIQCEPCIKCGHTQALTTYVAREFIGTVLTEGVEVESYYEEHLIRTCMCCSFSWLEKVKA